MEGGVPVDDVRVVVNADDNEEIDVIVGKTLNLGSMSCSETALVLKSPK